MTNYPASRRLLLTILALLALIAGLIFYVALRGGSSSNLSVPDAVVPNAWPAPQTAPGIAFMQYVDVPDNIDFSMRYLDVPSDTKFSLWFIEPESPDNLPTTVPSR